MSQEYLHACERAELLGLPKPSEEEWRQTQTTQNEDRCDDDDDKAIQDLDYADESARRIGGGLDELNSILSTTQKKLNRFKTVCGSLGTLLRVKVSSRGGTPQHKPEDPSNNARQEETQEEPRSVTDEVITVETTSDNVQEVAHESASGIPPKHIDLNQKMSSHLGKLDSLITKAENAQYSMQHQTKQMRKFLK